MHDKGYCAMHDTNYVMNCQQCVQDRPFVAHTQQKESEAAGRIGPATTYPDGNPKSAQGAKKYDLMYLPLPARIAVNQALEDGAKKYGKANWRQTGVSASVYLNAAARHIDQYNEGQEKASDSGVHNLGHAMACLAIIIDAAANGKLIDDRPFACVDTDALLLREVKP